MQVKVTEGKRLNEYPYIGKSKNIDLIVLFTSYKSGIVVAPLYKTGQFRDDWVEENFKLFTGEITLSNG